MDESSGHRSWKDADIVFAATVRAESMRFAVVPRTRVAFRGEPGEESVSGGRRVGLPERVAGGETYRRVRVEYVLASRLIVPRPR